ncbi:MFS transporter [bacterium]|nr:MAG: MFS transporter [bacterium]
MAKFREVLRNRNFFLLWLGQIISQIGDRLDQMALIGFITQRSPGKTLQLATLLSFTILPVFVIGPIAGVYVDRWDRRKTMYICDFLRGCLVLLIPLYLIDSRMPLLPLYCVVFLLFSIGRFFVPAKLAIVPELVPKEQILLANSLVNTTGMIAAVAGFGVAGVAVTILGVKGGFYLDAVSFFVSSLLVFSIRIASGRAMGIVKLGKEIVEVIRKSVLTEIKEGIGYLMSQRQMRIVLGVLFLVWAALGAIYVVMIVFIQETLKALTLNLGLLVMFLGAGLFFGSLIYGRFGKSDNCFKTIYFSLLASGLALSAFAIGLGSYPYFYTAALLAFIFGLTVAPIMTATNTLIHDISTGDMLGKVFSSIEIVMHLAFLLFMFLGSSLSEFKSIGRQGLLIGVGLLFSGIGLTGYLRTKYQKARLC